MLPECCTWTGCLKKTAGVRFRLVVCSKWLPVPRLIWRFSAARTEGFQAGHHSLGYTCLFWRAAASSRCWHTAAPTPRPSGALRSCHFTEVIQYMAKFGSWETKHQFRSGTVLQRRNGRDWAFWHSPGLSSPIPLPLDARLQELHLVWHTEIRLQILWSKTKPIWELR